MKRRHMGKRATTTASLSRSLAFLLSVLPLTLSRTARAEACIVAGARGAERAKTESLCSFSRKLFLFFLVSEHRVFFSSRPLPLFPLKERDEAAREREQSKSTLSSSPSPWRRQQQQQQPQQPQQRRCSLRSLGERDDGCVVVVGGVAAAPIRQVRLAALLRSTSAVFRLSFRQERTISLPLRRGDREQETWSPRARERDSRSPKLKILSLPPPAVPSLPHLSIFPRLSRACSRCIAHPHGLLFGLGHAAVNVEDRRDALKSSQKILFLLLSLKTQHNSFSCPRFHFFAVARLRHGPGPLLRPALEPGRARRVRREVECE